MKDIDAIKKHEKNKESLTIEGWEVNKEIGR
jgi:hypothetical protein